MDEVSALASGLFDAMFEEVMLDMALQTHRELARTKRICDICHTKCGGIHVPYSAASAPPTSLQPDASSQSLVNSRAGTPDPSNWNAASSSSKSDGNFYLDCLQCGKKIASTRYAQHLSSCMGVGNGRRGIVRTTTLKSKMAADGRSGSPYVVSDAGASDDGMGPPLSQLSKSTTPKNGKKDNKKRGASPSTVTPTNKKKAKTSVIPGDPLATPSKIRSPFNAPSSQTKIPSKLREQSVTPSQVAASSPAVSRSSSLSREESPGLDGAASPTSSTSSNSMATPLSKSLSTPARNALNGLSLDGSVSGKTRPSSSTSFVAPQSRRDIDIDVDGTDSDSSSSSD